MVNVSIWKSFILDENLDKSAETASLFLIVHEMQSCLYTIKMKN